MEDAHTAWSVGGNKYKNTAGGTLFGLAGNHNTLNIEMCVRKANTATMGAEDHDWYFEDATVDGAVALTKMLMQKYNVPAERVIRHYDVTGKICPNPYVYNDGRHTWEEFKARIQA